MVVRKNHNDNNKPPGKQNDAESKAPKAQSKELDNLKQDLNHEQNLHTSELEKLHKELEQKNFQITKLWEAFNREQEEKEAFKNSLDHEEKNYQKEKGHLLTLLQFRDYENKNLKHLVRNLLRWNEKLEKGICALLNSKRWKMGNTLGELLRKLLFRSRESMPADYLEETIYKYNEWVNERDLSPENKSIYD